MANVFRNIVFQEIFTLLPDIVDVALNSSLPVYKFITVPYGLKMTRQNSLECSNLEELLRCLTVSSWKHQNLENFNMILTHLFPMDPFSTPRKRLMFSGGRERVHWKRIG